jgi:hypothetical protein
MSEIITGFSDGSEFRDNNKYNQTITLLRSMGLTLGGLIEDGIPNGFENSTPPAIINIVHAFRMPEFQQEIQQLKSKPIDITITGVSTQEGPFFLEDAFKLFDCRINSTTVIDIDRSILDEIGQLESDTITCKHADARNTGLETASQDIIFNDHMGNCCPPNVNDKAIEESSRILKQKGIAMVNITSSDELPNSKNRDLICLNQLKRHFDSKVIEFLTNSAFDLHQIWTEFPNTDLTKLQGPIIEIAPESFVVFSNDQKGHGEWFRSFNQHINLWHQHGLELVGLKNRSGLDSHEPPLSCRRHNAILKKM